MKEIVLNIDVQGKQDVKNVTKDVRELDKASQDTAEGGLKDMIEQSGLFGQELEFVNRVKEAYNTGMRAMGATSATTATNTGKLSKALRVLKVALISTGIGAIAVVVGTLATAFFSTQEGVDALNRVLTPLKTGLEAVWGVIQDIATNFTDIIDGVVSGFRRTAEIAMAVASGEFKEAFDLTTSLIQDGVDTATNFGSSLVTAYTEGAEAGSRLVELEIELQELRRDSIVPLEELNRQFEIADTRSDNINLSLQERIDAIDNGIEAAQRMNDIQAEMLDKEIEILQIKQSQNDTTREEEIELQQLIAQRTRFEADQIARTRTLENRRNQLHEQQMTQLQEERAMQAEMNKLQGLDEDSVLEQEAILERIKDMRVEHESDLVDMSEEAVAARIATRKAERDAQLNLASEIGNSLMALGQLAGEQTIIGKALGVTSATIDTYVGANKALAQGGIAGPVAAAGIILTGLNNVRRIMSTQTPSVPGVAGGMASAPTSAPSPPPVRAPEVENESIQTVQTVFDQESLNVNVSVSETEISSTQNNVREIEQTATV